ncbi:MAG: NUDIX domain-containing protein [Candidatus Poribacteria bacterium]|nr:NUDIX domain-containing protein [Candidatus Poribacteria bacterium]
MSSVVEKVTAFVTRERNGVNELLLFRHPTAGLQIPAGTVEKGETPETAVTREVYEETGLRDVKIEKSLGCIENELEENERIVSQTTQVYTSPSLSSIVYKEELTRGMTVNYNATHNGFTHVSYIEYDSTPDTTCICCNITGWVPNEHLSARKTRYFFQLTTLEETASEWELKSDRGHIFTLFWAPLSATPPVVPPQNKWLDCVYDEID